MTTIARKKLIELCDKEATIPVLFDELDSLAFEKTQDFKHERTIWIFEDESAIWLNSYSEIGLFTKYGFCCDHEQLRGQS